MEVEILIGQIIRSIDAQADQMTFHMSDGSVYAFLHLQDCCEWVRIEDVVGDLQDLIDQPLLMAELVTSRENPIDIKKADQDDSFTWTFYKFATAKGYVTIRWYGESNGYYSESVDFVKLK